ncbi:Intraflagellar transport protein 46 like [Schistosoma japonicum]|nr:Intraflagellar transport protein 46 like [Schistosoma japonicum]
MDRPYDETVDIPDSEDIATPRLQQSLAENLDKLRDSYGDSSKLLTKTNSELANRSIKTASKSVIRMDSSSEKLCDRGSSDDDDDNDDDEDEDDDDDDDDENANIPDATEGVYNPADYEHLTVSSEIKEIFEYIQSKSYTNAIRYFLKILVPRPDGKPDYLGLLVLDEPCANQSDPTVLDLQLRALSKQTTTKQVIPKFVLLNMPEISQLMSEWPKSFEESISNMQLSLSQLDCSLKDYVDIICALLDIPVYNNRIHSLHLLFSLYLEFKNSQHFRQNESVIT